MNKIISEKITDYHGKDVYLFRIGNSSGSYVEILNYGATLMSIVVPDRNNELGNIILKYGNIEEYFSDNAYLGSTIGRVANRISDAQIEIDGQIYSLDKNDGNNSNHGGFNGFNKQIFDYKIEDEKLILSYQSRDGEGGFPGNLQFSVIYSFSENNELTIEYKAISDKPTYFNPTNHAYFNLSTERESILNHKLKVFADQYLESDNKFLPTGKILPVKNTVFDFSEYKSVDEMMPLKNEILKGYNTYFIASGDTEGLKKLGSIREAKSGRKVDLYSDMPGFMFYTGDYLSGKHQPFEGLCLEAQFYPDAPNQAHFPSCLIHPGKEYQFIIKLLIGCE